MDAQELLQQAKLNFAPPERIKVFGWAAKYYELSETSAEPGKWNPKRAPYQPAIMGNNRGKLDAEGIISDCIKKLETLAKH